MSESAVKEKEPQQQLSPREIEQQELAQSQRQFRIDCRKWAKIRTEIMKAEEAFEKAKGHLDELRQAEEGASYALMQRIDRGERIVQTEIGAVLVNRAEVKLVPLEKD